MSSTSFVMPTESAGSQNPIGSRRLAMAGFRTVLPAPGVAVVGAAGDIDASNCADFIACAALQIARCQTLIVDLGDVKYFGAEGYSALSALNDQCVAAGVQCVVIPNRDLARLLRICDVDGKLLTSATMQSALDATAVRRATS